MQCRNGIVELVTAFVVAAQALTQHAVQPGHGHQCQLLTAGSHGQIFQGVQQATGIAIGIGCQEIRRFTINSWQRFLIKRNFQYFLQIIGIQRLQHIHRCP